MGGYYSLVSKHIAHKIGLQFGVSNIDFGIKIYHYGHIVINSKAKVGKNLTIYPGVCIGRVGDKYPVIGDNVTFCTNSGVYGGITIGNNVTIAPNSIVTHDVPDNCVVAGVPAKIINKIGSHQ